MVFFWTIGFIFGVLLILGIPLLSHKITCPITEVNLETVYFLFDSSQLRPIEKKKLINTAQLLKCNPNMMIEIEGHTDERGSQRYNLELGQRRAEEVKEFLIDRGVNSVQLSTRSLGEEQPALIGSNSKAWAKNRRVEFLVFD